MSRDTILLLSWSFIAVGGAGSPLKDIDGVWIAIASRRPVITDSRAQAAQLELFLPQRRAIDAVPVRDRVLLINHVRLCVRRRYLISTQVIFSGKFRAAVFQDSRQILIKIIQVVVFSLKFLVLSAKVEHLVQYLSVFIS